MYELHVWEDPEDGDQVVLFTDSEERAEEIFLSLENRFAVPDVNRRGKLTPYRRPKVTPLELAVRVV
ncbi:hypothetical protein O4H52_20130, partial [Sphingomonadaceae bacterium G21617-S1]|nr:hypothetical protein [Sphingomonadaceae bacterium G21617-S1]